MLDGPSVSVAAEVRAFALVGRRSTRELISREGDSDRSNGRQELVDRG